MDIKSETILVFNEDFSCTFWNDQDDNITSKNTNSLFSFRGHKFNALRECDFWRVDHAELDYILKNFEFNQPIEIK